MVTEEFERIAAGRYWLARRMYDEYLATNDPFWLACAVLDQHVAARYSKMVRWHKGIE